MKITYEQIMSFAPCYDPKEIGMPTDYQADLKDFIVDYKDKVKSLENIEWVCLRKDFFNDRDLRLFAIWSASQVKHLMKDERSLNALEVAEKFSFGLVNENEIKAAAQAARAAAQAAADAVAWAADAVAWAADAVAWAAQAAARAAAQAAADAVAQAAADAVAWADAWAAQIDTLVKMIEKPNGEWFKEWKEQQ